MVPIEKPFDTFQGEYEHQILCFENELLVIGLVVQLLVW